jgi:hypothetical protein
MLVKIYILSVAHDVHEIYFVPSGSLYHGHKFLLAHLVPTMDINLILFFHCRPHYEDVWCGLTRNLKLLKYK